MPEPLIISVYLSELGTATFIFGAARPGPSTRVLALGYLRTTGPPLPLPATRAAVGELVPPPPDPLFATALEPFV